MAEVVENTAAEIYGVPGLAPCKKCGYEFPRFITYGHAFSNHRTYRISCPNCSYCTHEKKTKFDAKEAWNKPLHSPPRVKKEKSDLN